MSETLLAEWNRLADEKRGIQRAVRKAGAATAEQRQRHREIQQRLAEITTLPPDGYELPKAAVGLLEFAREHGWKTLAQWTPPDYGGEPYVTVEVGHKLDEQEARQHRSGTFHFKVTYHSRGCEPGKIKKFGTGLAKTPDCPQWHGAPSLKKIREVIAANPMPEARES